MFLRSALHDSERYYEPFVIDTAMFAGDRILIGNPGGGSAGYRWNDELGFRPSHRFEDVFGDVLAVFANQWAKGNLLVGGTGG